MTQKSTQITDGTGLEVLNQLNEAFETAITNNAGGTAPTTTYSSMFWVDTSGQVPILKQRNVDNTAWIELATIYSDGLHIATAVNTDLTNLSSEGQAKFAAKASISLDNLSAAGKQYIEETIAQKQADRIYDGTDLTQKFASEIQSFSTPWDWIKNRIQSGNYTGIHVGDFIPLEFSGGSTALGTMSAQTLNMQIAGIDTYKNCLDTDPGHHIDFISKEVMDLEVKWNPTANNNGTSTVNHPWLASQAYAWLNGVNNYSTSAYGSAAHGVNASNNGVFQKLPSALRNLIVEKRTILDKRYSASGLLTTSTDWSWESKGKLWLPDESEVYGCQYKSNTGQTSGWWNPEANMGVAYPLYLAQGRNRVKRTSSGARSSWWLSSAATHHTSLVCTVGNYGIANTYSATYAGIRCPLCFRL